VPQVNYVLRRTGSVRLPDYGYATEARVDTGNEGYGTAMDQGMVESGL